MLSVFSERFVPPGAILSVLNELTNNSCPVVDSYYSDLLDYHLLVVFIFVNVIQYTL